MPSLVTNLRQTRAFDKTAGTVVTLALAAGALGFGSPAQALPRVCYTLDAPCFVLPAPTPVVRTHSHRSIWAIRWERLHPKVAEVGQTTSNLRRVARQSWRQARRIGVDYVADAGKPIVKVAGENQLKITKPFKAAKRGSINDVTLDFVAADINDVLKALALQTGANVVSGNDVKGKVTVSLAHVSLDEALDMISKLSGYGYGKVGRTYVVGTSASLMALAASGKPQAAPITAVLSFNYSDPTDLGGAIKERFPDVKVTPGKSASGSGAGGVLVVTGPLEEVNGVRLLVQDQESALSRGIAASQTEVYKIRYAAADDLQSVLGRLVPGLVVTPGPTQGFNLKAPTTANVGGTTDTTAVYGTTAPGATVVTSPMSNLPVKPTTSSLLLTGSDSDIARARAILAQVDVKPAQIAFEAKVTELNRNSAKNLGLTYDFSNAKTSIGELLGPGETPDSKVFGVPHPGNIFAGYQFGRTPINQFVTVGLNALFTSGDAKLLSNPNISAIDGQPAAVFIGDTVRYISSITQTPTGQTVTTSSVDVGIKLFVTGKASDDGYVTVNIHPEVSLITGYLDVPGGGQLPQVSTREATTTVRVKDGDYIAIGGLITDQDIKNVRKVPFLGDIPFIGNLFKNTNHTSNRNEVVIFVKVSVQKDV